MDEKKEEEFDRDFDEDGFDPTKEAFFSGLLDMEEEIASEAYELVEHGIHLIESKFFDDAIEVLRFGMGGLEGRLRVDTERKHIVIKNREEEYLLLEYEQT